MFVMKLDRFLPRMDFVYFSLPPYLARILVSPRLAKEKFISDSQKTNRNGNSPTRPLLSGWRLCLLTQYNPPFPGEWLRQLGGIKVTLFS